MKPPEIKQNSQSGIQNSACELPLYICGHQLWFIQAQNPWLPNEAIPFWVYSAKHKREFNRTCLGMLARSLSLSRTASKPENRVDLVSVSLYPRKKSLEQPGYYYASTSGDQCVPAVIKQQSNKKRRLVQNHLFFGPFFHAIGVDVPDQHLPWKILTIYLSRWEKIQ